MRSGVADRQIHFGRKLTLDAEVVLDHVRSLQIEIHRLQLRANVRITIEIRDDIRERRIHDRCSSRKWRIEASREKVILRENLIEEQSKACPHGRLTCVEWIPGESDARRKVFQRWVVMPRRSNRHSGIRYFPKVRDLAVDFGRHGDEFITQPRIDCEISAQAHVILREECEKRLTIAANGI